jgi:opacity protein-like surface antigen
MYRAHPTSRPYSRMAFHLACCGLFFLLALPSAAMARKSAAAETGPPPARAHRLAISLNLGLGSVNLGSYHSAINDLMTRTAQTNGFTLQDNGTSNLQYGGSLSLRYYFPYFIWAELGAGAIFNMASAVFSKGTLQTSIDSYNLLVEVPILVGGYYTLFDRLYLHAGVGLDILVLSYGLLDPGSDFQADLGVGMQASLGADYLVADSFALGLEVRYRHAKMKPMKIKGSNTIVTSGQIKGDGSSNTYDLDFSGVSLLLNLRIFAI